MVMGFSVGASPNIAGGVEGSHLGPHRAQEGCTQLPVVVQGGRGYWNNLSKITP